MFSSDQPIKSHKDDILGRYSFAQSLANAIISYKEKQSIVIGLFGEWGSGKTSIINMVLEYVEANYKGEEENKCPIIIKFNPWYFSDQNQLITQFFSQLSTDLGRIDTGERVAKLGQTLQKYARYFKPLKYVPGLTSVGNAAEALDKTGSSFEKVGKDESTNVFAIKAELDEILTELNHKIIIVIDDIDRLNNTEIRQIFQLVKSLCDFPNTIYLIAFDKNVIIKALSKVQEGPGLDYLEKVVQVPFEIPQISKSEIEKLLFNQLNEILTDIPEGRWDRNHWENIYHSGLKYFFKSIRDVNRYINSLRFSYELLKNEVNPVDLFAITGIQVFIPDIYYGIRDNKDIFSGTIETYTIGETQKELVKNRLDEILKRNNVLPPEVLIDFLKYLFPRTDTIYNEIGYSYGHLESWRKEGRIASPDNFNIFFRLTISEGEVSRDEIENILSLGIDITLFSEALLKLNEEGRIIRFLERLEDYTQNEIPEDNIEPIITVLLDIGDLLPEGESGLFVYDTPLKILRISHQLVHRFDNPETRFKIFQQAILNASQSIHTIVNEVNALSQEHGKYGIEIEPGQEKKQTVTLEHYDELEKLALKKIETWANDGRLMKARRLHDILLRWKDWGNKEDIDNFIKNMIKDDDGLITLITNFLYRSTSYSEYSATIHWRIDPEDLNKFIDYKEIEPKIRNIFNSNNFEKLGKKEQIAIKTFLDIVDGNIKGVFFSQLDEQ
ncbi:MAG: KAP family P-loop NTPase fold protein [Promethearchaeota archaeon]|jgi:predicted KAP-like P-loop ATPase